jgi:hypothetical protein
VAAAAANPDPTMRIPLLLLFAPVLPLAAQDLNLRPLAPPAARTLLPAAAATTTPANGGADADARAQQAAAEHLAAPRTGRVVFDRPREDEPLWGIGDGWKASFDARGLTFVPFFGSDAPRNYPLRVELTGATVGGEPLALGDGEPRLHGRTVRTARGALTEVIDAYPGSLEQSFVFERLPSRGAIAVDVRIDTELAPAVIAGGLRFANERGHVDYTKAVAVDAAGKRLPLAIEWTGTSARIEIPAAFVEQAQLPLVLDPTLNGWFALASGQTQLQHDSDVATFQAGGGRTLVIYQRQWSLTDQDCWGILFDGSLGLVATDFSIDFTSQDWLKVAVAGSNYAQNFLVVAEIRIGALWFIGGRTIAGNGTQGAVFDIERELVVGFTGNNHHPDVGSDPYFGVGRYTVVFNKRTPLASDIYMKQVTTSGGLVTTNPVALDLSPNVESRPSISKSCGQSNGPQASWLATWQRTFSIVPADEDVHGRYIGWNGALVGSLMTMAATSSMETAPSASSPIDVDGVRYWPVCYELAPAPGQPRDVVARLFRADNLFAGAFTVSNNVPGADDRDPEVDSDGTRFVCCLTTQVGTAPAAPEAVTIAWLPSSSSFRVEERTGLGTSSLQDYGQTNLCADYSGGSTLSPRYVLTFTETSTNTFTMWAYGGWRPGNFFSVLNNECGSLSISASGSPVIGQTVTFTVGGGALSGTILGFPGFIPLNVLGCNCWQGVDQGLYLGNPLSWTVPNNPIYVGYTLSVQGWTIGGSQCLGFVDLSDTIDFTIR